MKYRLYKHQHSFFSIQFHYVCCVKNRQSLLIDEEVKTYLKKLNQSIAKKFKVKIIEDRIEIDHIHIIFSSKPQICVSTFVNSLKSVTARKLMLKFPHLKNNIQTEGFWEPNYFLASIGEVEPTDINCYINKYKVTEKNKNNEYSEAVIIF